MSPNTKSARRLSLLASASLVAASLAMIGGAANAQATCTSPPAPTGNGTNSVTIAAGTYDPGVTCAYTGTAATISTAGAVTVSTTAGGDGINLSATGSSRVSWDSSAGTVTGGAQTNGAVIEATTDTGDIVLTTASVAGHQAGTTYGVRANSTGGGDIAISTSGGISSSAASNLAGVSATTAGGDINISGYFAGGRLRGILAQTGGAGSVVVTLSGQTSSSLSGGAAIDVTAGTGGVTLNINGAQGGDGKALVVASTGGAVVNNIGTIGGVSFDFPTTGGAVDFSGVTGGGVTFNNTGTARWLATGASVFSGGADTVSMSGTGVSKTADGATIAMGGGADTWNVGTLLGVDDTAIDFGTGTDAFNLTGRLSINGGLTLSNLEAFNNSGVIFLGTYLPIGWSSPDPIPTAADYTITDGETDDVFVMHSGTFTGSGASRIVVDANLSSGEQADCSMLTGAADCLDLRDASTAGVTLVTVNNIAPDATLGSYTPVGVTIVDVSGAGASGAGHFVLDPGTTGYVDDPAFGPVIERPGLFRYGLRYDAANQRHALVGLPRSEAMEYAMLSGAAQSIWHMTTETVVNRQLDQRAGAVSGPLWMRVTGEYSKRDVTTDFSVFGDSFAYDNSYKLYAGTVIAGVDLIRGSTGLIDYVLGGQLGYVGSSFDLEASASSGRFTGATGGFYGSLWNKLAFIDGALNFNGLTLDYDAPGIGSKTNTFLSSLGGRIDAGAHLTLGETFFIEPLTSLAFMRTGFEEVSLLGGEVKTEDSKSLRGAVGVRVGGDVEGQAANFSYFVTARSWNEWEGETRGSVANPGTALPFTDDLSGAFSEAEAGLSLYNAAGTLSGYATSGVKWKDGYSATNLSLGLRMAW